MQNTQVQKAPPSLIRRILVRAFTILLVGVIFSIVTSFAHIEKPTGPAGFGRGLLHGAMMPAAMLNLLIGRDVPIYASVNTGRTYKLGYTAGVNGCGAIFFGIFFWRINRWRKRLKPASA